MLKGIAIWTEWYGSILSERNLDKIKFAPAHFWLAKQNSFLFHEYILYLHKDVNISHTHCTCNPCIFAQISEGSNCNAFC